MSDMFCGYTDREATLMAYVYDEIGPAERREFDAHLSTCARCRSELTAFGGVRQQLARWSPPSFASVAAVQAPTPQAAPSRTWWREIPAWAQVAAALLVLGVAAGIANLDVRYDQSGLTIRTGWSRPSAIARDTKPVNAVNAANSANPANASPWQSDLIALQRQLRDELHAAQTPPAATGRVGANESEVLRRVRALVDESERRQQRELALRLAAAMSDLNAQRQSDLRRIDHNLGIIEDRTGVEVLRNRRTLDLLMQRVSVQQ